MIPDQKRDNVAEEYMQLLTKLAPLSILGGWVWDENEHEYG